MIAIRRIQQDRDSRRLRNRGSEHLEHLAGESFRRKCGQPGSVGARPGQAGDQTQADGVAG